MAFSVNGGNVTDVFITDAEFIDRFVGNQLWLWGQGAAGALGNNSIVSRSSPVQTVSNTTDWRQVDTSVGTSAAIKTNGTLWVWGTATGGALGNNSTINRSSPVQTVSVGTNWKQVSTGYQAQSAIKTDGTLWVWGCAALGTLGNNSTINRSSPVQTVSVGTNWKQVSVRGRTMAAIKTDGTLWLWGQGAVGRLGNESTTNRSSPVQTVSAETNWAKVASTGYNTAAIKTDGTLWLWGQGTFGSLGNNSTLNEVSPVQTVAAGTNWKQVGGYDNLTAAIKTDGTLWLWGYNLYGGLGNNSVASLSSPVQTIAAGTNWKQVAAGGYTTAAVKTDGTLWLWGKGGCGNFGNNSTLNRSSPVQTIAAGTNWKQVSAGDNISAVTFNS